MCRFVLPTKKELKSRNFIDSLSDEQAKQVYDQISIIGHNFTSMEDLKDQLKLFIKFADQVNPNRSLTRDLEFEAICDTYRK